MIEFLKGFEKKLYNKKYIFNGIRVMKKYLFPSLKYQSCKDFIWILNVGNKANITYLKSLLNFTKPFKSIIIYNKELKSFIKNITKNIDVLITTRIDYDDRIYYNAVNDVRKYINFSRPIILYGYNRRYIYYEEFDIYFIYHNKYHNAGTGSIFASLIIILNKINDSYNIYDLGDHTRIRKNLLKKYKNFGLKKLDYEPAIFENGAPKCVWVRQRYSGIYRKGKPKVKVVNFDLGQFYGIKK